MPHPPRKPQRKRNASAPKRKGHRPRNAVAAAAPARPRLSQAAREVVAAGADWARFKQLGEVLQSVLGAAAASYVGAQAVRTGFHPGWVSLALSSAGGLLAWRSDRPFLKLGGIGAASAAGSQLMLLGMNPRIGEPAPAQTAVAQLSAPTPARATVATKPRAADLGGLEPGMLDAALERARAELAVAGDGYPPGYAPAPRVHHAHSHGT